MTSNKIYISVDKMVYTICSDFFEKMNYNNKLTFGNISKTVTITGFDFMDNKIKTKNKLVLMQKKTGVKSELS